MLSNSSREMVSASNNRCAIASRRIASIRPGSGEPWYGLRSQVGELPGRSVQPLLRSNRAVQRSRGPGRSILPFVHRPSGRVFAHAQAGDHGARQVGNSFQVIGSARGDIVEDQFFSSAPAQQPDHFGQHFLAGHQGAVFFGQSKGITTRHATCNDRHFMHRISLREVHSLPLRDRLHGKRQFVSLPG